MDRLDMPLDQLVSNSRKSTTSKKPAAKKAAPKKGKVVKSSSSRSVGAPKARPARELKQPTAKQVVHNLGKFAGDSILSRLGSKLEGCAVVISNLNYNISQGDIRELCATVGNTGKIFVRPGTGSADVWFERHEDALRMCKRYNRMTLDGRPMRVAMKDAIKKEDKKAPTLVFGSTRGRDKDFDRREDGRSQGPTTFSVTMAGSGKGGKKGNAPRQKKDAPILKAKSTKQKKEKKKEKQPTAAPAAPADLDADMDSYFANRKPKGEEEAQAEAEATPANA